MKKILLTILSSYALAAPLLALNITGRTDLNSTPAELISVYGKPVKIERGWYGAGVSYTFRLPSGVYLYATTNPARLNVEDVIYTRPGKPFSDKEKAELINRNSDSRITYYGDYHEFGVNFDYDGTETVKRRGKERDLTVKSDYNWTHQIFAKTTEEGGYQIRTRNQFDLEQKFLK